MSVGDLLNDIAYYLMVALTYPGPLLVWAAMGFLPIVTNQVQACWLSSFPIYSCTTVTSGSSLFSVLGQALSGSNFWFGLFTFLLVSATSVLAALPWLLLSDWGKEHSDGLLTAEVFVSLGVLGVSGFNGWFILFMFLLWGGVLSSYLLDSEDIGMMPSSKRRAQSESAFEEAERQRRLREESDAQAAKQEAERRQKELAAQRQKALEKKLALAIEASEGRRKASETLGALSEKLEEYALEDEVVLRPKNLNSLIGGLTSVGESLRQAARADLAPLYHPLNIASIDLDREAFSLRQSLEPSSVGGTIPHVRIKTRGPAQFDDHCKGLSHQIQAILPVLGKLPHLEGKSLKGEISEDDLAALRNALPTFVEEVSHWVASISVAALTSSSQSSRNTTSRLPSQNGSLDAFDYDVALSYAGEDIEIVRSVYRGLQDAGVNSFFDRPHSAELWGEDLEDRFEDIYKTRSRFVMVFSSRHYRRKDWPRFEFQAAKNGQASRRRTVILPVRLDGTPIVGINPSTKCFDYVRDGGTVGVVKWFLQKLHAEVDDS